MGTTQAVLNNHLNSFREGNLKGILSDYAPGAVLFTPDGPLRGPEAIGAFFIRLLAEFGKPGAVFSMEAQFVEGDYGYILWTAGDLRQPLRARHGHLRRARRKIAVQSFAGKTTPKN